MDRAGAAKASCHHDTQGTAVIDRADDAGLAELYFWRGALGMDSS